MGYWVRVRVGDVPPPARPVADSEPRWVRAGIRTVVSAAPPPARSAESEPESESLTPETWLVDSFELVVPRYPWQKATETDP
ncbi:hypothetical protein [Saccharothrix deserti]|uniref:hypothetical protein n=1 Tax=Saccharothrix deserti TaxID=2593674 RepID=UPI00131DA2B9|nr:hypothetical protein [Saccharothrix deserti]